MEKLRYALNLQMFADPFGIVDFGSHTEDGGDVDSDPDVGTSIDDYDQDVNNEITQEADPNERFEALDEDDYEDSEEVKTEEETTSPEEEPPADDKPWKTPENAHFAEQRRQQEAAQRAIDNSPQAQFVRQMEQHYGMPFQQLQQQMQQAQAIQSAERLGVPVEIAVQMQNMQNQIAAMNQQTQMREYQEFTSRVAGEQAAVAAKYPVLTDEDFGQALDYQLRVLQRPDLSVEQVVNMIHGQKIMDYAVTNARNESLAQASGRANASIPQAAVKATKEATDDYDWSPEEDRVRQQMGVSRADWKKNRV